MMMILFHVLDLTTRCYLFEFRVSTLALLVVLHTPYFSTYYYSVPGTWWYYSSYYCS